MPELELARLKLTRPAMAVLDVGAASPGSRLSRPTSVAAIGCGDDTSIARVRHTNCCHWQTLQAKAKSVPGLSCTRQHRGESNELQLKECAHQSA